MKDHHMDDSSAPKLNGTTWMVLICGYLNVGAESRRDKAITNDFQIDSATLYRGWLRCTNFLSKKL